MPIISYTTFQFNIPEELSDSDYKILKEVLSQDPGYKINPPYSFIEYFNVFKVHFILMGIGVAGFILSALKIYELIVIIVYLVGLAGFLSFLPSQVSLLKFLYDKSKYYSKLEKDIISSTNFGEFQNLRAIISDPN